MATWRRHRTTVDSIIGQLLGIDLSNAVSIEGHVVQCSSGATAVLPGAIIDAANSVARLDLTPWLPAAEVGPWDLTWHPTFGDGSAPVWPEAGSDQIIVLS